MEPVNYVNYLGEKPHPERHKAKPKAAREQVSSHKGWRVYGISQKMIADAEEGHERVRKMAEASGGAAIAPWSLSAYLDKTKPRPAHSRPYEIQSSALERMRLAQKAGWVNLEIRELKREAA